MRGLGTVVNVAAVLAGSGVGLLTGRRLPEQIRATALTAIGLATLGVGVASFLETANAAFPVAAVVGGAVLGELAGIEDHLDRLGRRFHRLAAGRADGPLDAPRAKFVEGYVVASLTFCVGALTVVGSLQDGISGDSHLLIVKSALDGVAAAIFASVYGAGVAFASLTILVVQGSLTVIGATVGADVLSPRMVAELEATGGVLILGVGLRLLGIKPVRVASLLPALALAPALVALFAR